MEFTVKTAEEALVVYAYKVLNKQVKPTLIHNEDRVWVRSEYTITGIKYGFTPYGELILVNAPMGI